LANAFLSGLEIRGLGYTDRVPKPDVSARSTTIQGQDSLKDACLTRDDVAKRLGVSVSTVRRLEGSRLHPLITDKGVRRFKPGDVEQLAAVLAAEQNTPRNAEKAAVRAVELTKGELAALVFERLEQRHSLAEIVIALRVPPDDVRELYHTWLVGLWAGELQRSEPALPMRHTEQDVTRRVTRDQLAQLLAGLPDHCSTRISVARAVGEYVIHDGANTTSAGFVEYRNLAELGGFIVPGPITVSEITDRFGVGEYRISAYALDAPGLRWEVFAMIDEESGASHDATLGAAKRPTDADQPAV
jgi:DNA-binding transcriptional MerR regulator